MPFEEPIGRNSATTNVVTQPTDYDRHSYQRGFGNHHSSEAIPGALPPDGTKPAAKDSTCCGPSTTRAVSKHVNIESCFLPTNPNVKSTPLGHTWGPLPIAKGRGEGHSDTQDGITFVEGFNTLAGHGDPATEGVAIHQYAFNTNMKRQASVNHDGELLIVPQRGALDCQTELGHLRVRVGAVVVIPAGIRFSICTASPEKDVCGSGYAFEVFGSHFILPELGPLGANCLAHPREFEYPVASFDLDPQLLDQASTPWEITIKLAGKLHYYTQRHTPYDVVAWHGRLAPYKYELDRFGQLTANRDQLDPTGATVLTALSRLASTAEDRQSLVDFYILTEKAAVAKNTFRPPYHHRNVAAESVGLIHGKYKGSVKPLEPGGLAFEQSYSPHGESYETWMTEREKKLGMEVVGRGYMGFSVHVPKQVMLTTWAMEEHPDIRLEREDFWDGLKGHFLDNIDDINQKLVAAGRSPIRFSH